MNPIITHSEERIIASMAADHYFDLLDSVIKQVNKKYVVLSDNIFNVTFRIIDCTSCGEYSYTTVTIIKNSNTISFYQSPYRRHCKSSKFKSHSHRSIINTPIHASLEISDPELIKKLERLMSV